MIKYNHKRVNTTSLFVNLFLINLGKYLISEQYGEVNSACRTCIIIMWFEIGMNM